MIFVCLYHSFHILTQRDWVPVFVIAPLVKRNTDNLGIGYTLPQQIAIEQVEQQYRFPAPSETGHNLYVAIPHSANHPVQVIIPFNHPFHLIL